jgi:hypothetical protein
MAKRVKVVPEKVREESPEVLYARILDLWERSDNYRHAVPLREEAFKLGFELPSDRFGIRKGERL